MSQSSTPQPSESPFRSSSGEQLGLLKRQAYLVALPLTLLAVVLTFVLDRRGAADHFNGVALPLLAAALLVLTVLLLLRRVPLRWFEHSFYLVVVGSFFTKFGHLALHRPLVDPNAEMAQVYIWAPFVYLLGFVVFNVEVALRRSLLVYVLSVALGVWAVLVGGVGGLGHPARLTEFYLASGLWVAMLFALGTLKTRLAHLQARYGELERLAHHDALTGLGNRRQMEGRLERHLADLAGARASGALGAGAVVLFDIDDFKRVNDVHGHDLGDAVLRETAGVMQRELRDAGALARWGGEEFVVLLPQGDVFRARALAERLRAALARHPFGTVGRVTASFGVAACRGGEGVPDLLRRADRALYRAKRGGKNRVEAADLPTPPPTRPELRSPFPTRLPAPDPTLCRETADWLGAFGLGPGDAPARQAFAANLVGLAAALHPHAPHASLRLTADWYSLMFLHDDRCDAPGGDEDPARRPALARRLLAVFGGEAPRPGDEPLAHALADLRARLLACGGTRWFGELTERVRDYLNALAWEAANRAGGTVPELGEYLRRRPVTAGLNIDAAFLEVMDGVDLPAHVRDHPAVRRLAACADRAVCWSNDVLSLDKELRDGDVHNLVLVLMRARGLGVQAALEEAARMYHAEVEAFLTGAHALPTFGPEEDARLRRYVGLLQARVGGILAWSQGSGRYQTPELVA